MHLRELMSTRVVTIESTESANAAWNRMRRHRIRHLVVTEDGTLSGMLSERDLGGPRGNTERHGHTVEDLMTRQVVTAAPAMRLRDAANLMRGREVGSLPVLDGDRLVGIVTATDVLDAIGRGATRPTRRPEQRTERMTQSRRQAARPPVVRRRSSARQVGRARPRQPESAKRAPFYALVSRTSRRAGAMSSAVPAHIRAAEGDLDQHDRDYIRRKLGRRLGKFSDAIERVSVRTRDVNGPRGGIDRVCRIKVVLSGLPSVVFESRDASLRAAVDRALAGVERAAARRLARVRAKRLRPAA